MGLVDGRKVYISRIDAATNTIELALWEELFKTEVWARNFNWLIDEPREPIRASVRVRHKMGKPALHRDGGGRTCTHRMC